LLVVTVSFKKVDFRLKVPKAFALLVRTYPGPGNNADPTCCDKRKDSGGFSRKMGCDGPDCQCPRCDSNNQPDE